jgi:hypothetical protein
VEDHIPYAKLTKNIVLSKKNVLMKLQDGANHKEHGKLIPAQTVRDVTVMEKNAQDTKMMAQAIVIQI